MADMRKKFNDKIEEMASKKNENCIILSKQKYDSLIADLKRIKIDGVKEKSDYFKRDRYECRAVKGVDKLFKPNTNLEFIPQTDLFDAIHTKHIALTHAGRNNLQVDLAKEYVNVTREIIMAYLTLCEQCQRKKNKTKKHIVVKPIISNDFNSRCQVDLIDMQSQPDRNFRFIMVYQDHLTKFVQLRALQTKTAEEVADALVDIFCIFGAPHILHSDNGREFENALLKEVLALWPQCKLVHGKPRHSQSQGSVERANKDVEDKLKCWMGDNKTNKWSEGLRFVQFSKNRCFHSGIKRSPYKAIFGADPKVGLSTTILRDATSDISTEDDLERALLQPCTDQTDAQENSANGPDIANESIENMDTEPTTINCITCQRACSNAHACKECKIPCHTICGTPVEEEGYSGAVICQICERGQAVHSERKNAKRGLIDQAEKMQNASNKRLKPAQVGDNVTIPISEFDRGRADHRNIIGVVMEVQDDFYKIGTEHGVLKKYVHAWRI